MARPQARRLVRKPFPHDSQPRTVPASHVRLARVWASSRLLRNLDHFPRHFPRSSPCSCSSAAQSGDVSARPIFFSASEPQSSPLASLPPLRRACTGVGRRNRQAKSSPVRAGSSGRQSVVSASTRTASCGQSNRAAAIARTAPARRLVPALPALLTLPELLPPCQRCLVRVHVALPLTRMRALCLLLPLPQSSYWI